MNEREPRSDDVLDDPAGRSASSPTEIPRRGWWDVLKRTRRELGDDDVGLVAAAVAFYLFLALFPALAAGISVYGLVADPAQVREQLQALDAVPGGVREVISSQLERLAAQPTATLGWTLAGSVLVALWSASKGMRALMKALNVAYGEDEDRGFVRRLLVSFGFTAGALVLALLAAGVIVAVPALFRRLDLGTAGRWAGVVAAWVALVAGFVGSLVALYRWAPSRTPARWRWITPGAVVAALLWVGASALFSFYAARFGSYGETYGSLAGVVVLLLWLWISALTILVGAELDAELEHQTLRDTTTGPRRPRGERGARVADTAPRGT